MADSPDPDRSRETLAVYEASASRWRDSRRPDPARARAFADDVAGDAALPPGAVADLGCGPGWHLSALEDGLPGREVVGLDAAAAMLRLAASESPGAALVQADLGALPFARGSLAVAWASRSLVHLPRTVVPMALWDLHRSLAVGGVARLALFGGDAEHEGFDGDDFPGRSFSLWPEDRLRHVLTGAGLVVEHLEVGAPRRAGHVPDITVTVRRLRTLADTVGPGMRLLLVGLNPSLHAADSGVGFSGPGNRGWPALVAAGIATTSHDPRRLLTEDRIGMTDLVKRATATASELAAGEFRDGLDRLEALCSWLRPGAVCVVGLTGWRHAVDRRAQAGPQAGTLGGRPVWLMPNPSGLNTHSSLAELTEHFVAAAELAGRHR